MNDGTVRYGADGPIATVTFDRPRARNAMTWTMYEEFLDVLENIGNDPDLRVLLLRGAGDQAFVAGTDITQFQDFTTGQEGVDYNARIDRVFVQLEGLRIPTIAVTRGAVVGGGLAIAASCDLRISADDARFGVPVARTLGNLPSMATLTRLVALVGPARTKEMLFTARLWQAEEALTAGLITEAHAPEHLDARVAEICDVLIRRAPLTMAGVKEAVRRIVDGWTPTGEDLIREVYGSEDFREGRTAFVDKRSPTWRAR